MRFLIRTLAVACAFAATAAFAQQDYFSNWPAGTAPQEVGKRVAEHFVTSQHQYSATIHYSEICTWYGALTFAQLTHDDALRTKLVDKFAPLMPGGAEEARIPQRHHVDVYKRQPQEIEYYEHGGILQYVLRQLAAK